MLHRILAIHGRDTRRAKVACEVARTLDWNQWIVGAVLHHDRNAPGVVRDRTGDRDGAHRQDARRVRFRRIVGRDIQPERKREPAALRESGEDRVGAVETERSTLLVGTRLA